MKALVVDDEELARVYLKNLLAGHGVEVVGEGTTGLDALRLSEQVEPDILFLDIQMPDLTGMQVAAALSQLAAPPLLVFVTGFAEHAPDAFRHAAFDYLLKPVTQERLALTLSRAKKARNAPARNRLGKDVLPEPTARIPIRTDYAVKLVRVADIACAVAKEKRVYLRAATSDYKTYYTLNQLESMLPKADFMRIHASAIVRLSQIEELNFLGNHSYSVKLTCGLVLPVGRSHYQDLQKALGLPL